MDLIDRRKLSKSDINSLIRLAKYLKIKGADRAKESISLRMKIEELVVRALL